MGIDIEAKLLYGLPYSDLPEEILEDVDEIPEILVSDDIDLSVYVTPHVY